MAESAIKLTCNEAGVCRIVEEWLLLFIEGEIAAEEEGETEEEEADFFEFAVGAAFACGGRQFGRCIVARPARLGEIEESPRLPAPMVMMSREPPPTAAPLLLVLLLLPLLLLF